jgi:hypothetical protein
VKSNSELISQYPIYLIYTLDKHYRLVPVKTEMPMMYIQDWIQSNIFWPINRVSIEYIPENHNKCILTIDKGPEEVKWQITFSKQYGCTLQVIPFSMLKNKYSCDAADIALYDKIPPKILGPDILSDEQKNELTNKRQLVYMGVGPNREKELLLTKRQGQGHNLAIFAQIDSKHWNNMCSNEDNSTFNLPNYNEIQTMSELTLYYPNVTLVGDSNLYTTTTYGSRTVTKHKQVGVAFIAGVRLERPKNGQEHTGTDWERTRQNDTQKIDMRKYSNLVKKRIEPIFKTLKDVNYWFTPFGLGVYAEAEKDKKELGEAWVKGIFAAAPNKLAQKLHLPKWTSKVLVPSAYALWQKMGGVIDVGHLQDEVYYKNWVAIIPGDPVALPGNEAALGMLKGSGDPFSLSYLAYLPYDGNNLDLTIGPYHWQCREWMRVASGQNYLIRV